MTKKIKLKNALELIESTFVKKMSSSGQIWKNLKINKSPCLDNRFQQQVADDCQCGYTTKLKGKILWVDCPIICF
jgi:hypothetical protein